MIAFVFFLSSLFGAVPAKSEDLRTLFMKAVNSESAAKNLYSTLSSQKLIPSDPAFAYLGAAETLMGKHAISPFAKLEWLDKGLEKINQSVASRPSDPVPIYLRISVESAVPSFLGRNKHLESDKSTILSLFQKQKNNSDCTEILKTGKDLLGLNVLNKNQSSLLQNYIKSCNH